MSAFTKQHARHIDRARREASAYGGGQPAVSATRLMSPSRRSGMTLIELMVALAIISILAGLLLLAVGSARAASRRMACQNNIRQLGLAVHHHIDSFKHFPVSVSVFPEAGPTTADLNGRGWLIETLPFMEQSALSDQFEQSRSGDMLAGAGLQRPECRQAMSTPLSILKCPSDISQRISALQFEWFGIDVAVTSYKGVIGDTRLGGARSQHPGSEPDCHQTRNCNGIFFRNSYLNPVRLPQILDGQSTTLMIGEDLPDQNAHSAAFYSNGDWASCHAPINFFPAPERPFDWWDVMSFRSYHNGGVNFCLADGSVRFLVETIDHDLYRALSTKAEGEVANLP